MLYLNFEYAKLQLLTKCTKNILQKLFSLKNCNIFYLPPYILFQSIVYQKTNTTIVQYIQKNRNFAKYYDYRGEVIENKEICLVSLM